MQMVDLKTSGDLAVIFTCKSNLMVFTSPQLVLEYSPFKVTRTGEQEIQSIYRRHRDNPGELAFRLNILASCTYSQYVRIFVLQHYIYMFLKAQNCLLLGRDNVCAQISNR